MFNLQAFAKEAASQVVNTSKQHFSTMRLSSVVHVLNSFAPLNYAEKWDNVGLLVEPSSDEEIKSILLTNDLTEAVLNEALEHKANLIVSYHPPIFSGLKRLTSQTWKERIIVKCIENKIAIYSPHTSWDSSPKGVNDWLAAALPIKSKIIAIPNAANPDFGGGRVCEVEGKLSLAEAVERIKLYTQLPDVRVGIATEGSMNSEVKVFGVCAGSGASILKDIKQPIDLFITGELSHHEALEAIHNQTSVITLNHSNSERGYLTVFKGLLVELLSDKSVKVLVSETDADPLKTF